MKMLELTCWVLIILIGIINIKTSLDVGIFLFAVADLVAYVMLVVSVFLTIRDIKKKFNYKNIY